MLQNSMDQESTYRIRIKGILNRSMAEWFGDITILSQINGETLLAGVFTDQAALRGFLEQLWNLNFAILYVERISEQSAQNFNQSWEIRRCI